MLNKPPHKDKCKHWRKFYGNGPGDSLASPVPICLRSIDLVEEDLLALVMRQRADAFCEELKRCVEHKDDSCKGIGLQAEVLNSFGVIRLRVKVLFVDGNNQIHGVNEVIFEKVDDGADAKGLLSSRNVSVEASQILQGFVKQSVNSRGLHVHSIFLGKGLHWLAGTEAEAEPVRAFVEERNKESNGTHRRILWKSDCC